MIGLNSTNTVSNEQSLILLCSSTRLTRREKEEIRSLLDKSPDWDLLLNTASRNGLRPLISWNLLKLFGDKLPGDIEESMREYLNDHTRRNLFLTRKLISIVQDLEDLGIPTLPFKGTTLAHRAYGNLALRDYVDLDILVKPKHFYSAVDCLVKKGFVPHGDGSWAQRRTPGLSRRKDIGLSDKESNVHIELHWKISGSHFGLPFEIHSLWERLEKIQLGGASINALSFQDLLVYLCLHGSRHGWEKLAWLFDLRELIEAHESSRKMVNWVEIRNHAREYGCEKVVELSVYLLEYFLDYKVDYPGIEMIRNEDSFKEIADSIWRKTLTPVAASSEIGDWYFYHLTLKERKTDRLRVHFYYIVWYLRLVFTPNAMDKAIFPLPRVFYPLYFVLRPFRLLVGYFSFYDKDTNR